MHFSIYTCNKIYMIIFYSERYQYKCYIWQFFIVKDININVPSCSKRSCFFYPGKIYRERRVLLQVNKIRTGWSKTAGYHRAERAHSKRLTTPKEVQPADRNPTCYFKTPQHSLWSLDHHGWSHVILLQDAPVGIGHIIKSTNNHPIVKAHPRAKTFVSWDTGDWDRNNNTWVMCFNVCYG